jgi:hypothetical protein
MSEQRFLNLMGLGTQQSDTGKCVNQDLDPNLCEV